MNNHIRSVIVLLAILTFCGHVFAQATKTLAEKDRFNLAADYSARNKGVSVLVMKGDRIVFEDYENGHTRPSRGRCLAAPNRFPA